MTVSVTLFNCHKFAQWSQFLTFHEFDFATTVPMVLFTRNCSRRWLN